MFVYDVISKFRSLILPLVPSKMRFFRNFFVSSPIKFKFGTGTQNWVQIHIAISESGFRDDFGQYGAKPLFYAHFWRFFALKPLQNSVAMATPKIPGVKNYLKRCLINKKSNSESFSFLDLTVSELCSKNQLGGGKFAPSRPN